MNTGNRSVDRKQITTLFLVWVIMGLPFIAVGIGHAADFCSRTSETTLSACLSDIETERSISFGKFYNIADAKERTKCKKEAREEASEGPENCYDQFEAREEVCEELGKASYDPMIDPGNCVEITSGNANAYMPLAPGPTMTYEGDGELIEVTVTTETKEILGVT